MSRPSFEHLTDDRQSPSPEAVHSGAQTEFCLTASPLSFHAEMTAPQTSSSTYSPPRYHTSNPQGRLILRINGHEASYLEELSEGDDIQIYWDKAIVR